MKTKILSILIGLGCFIQPLFAQDTATNAAPVIPEAARKHFVMGAALFKDAKTAEDYAQVTGEFEQAAELAPQWPEARYNLALSKEAAGDYAGAMDDLKRYQAFKLSETEVRTVQDKIYVVEAKLTKTEKKKAVEQVENSAETKREKYLNSLVGRWELNSGNLTCHFEIARHDSGELFDISSGARNNGTGEDNSITCENIKMEGDILKFREKYANAGYHEYAVRINRQGNLSCSHVFWERKTGEYLDYTRSVKVYKRSE